MKGESMQTDAAVEKPIEELPYSDPDELATGQPLPMKDWIFRTPDGTRKKIRIQGLTYAEKSVEDIRNNQERAEAEKMGIVKSDLRAARILAKAVRTAEGKRKFTKEEDQILYAIKISEQMADGEISRAYNAVMDLSGYSDEALADAGKA